MRSAGEPARRAWHLAEASTGPDENVACLLQQVAHADLFRGDAVTAIKELLRAADLSPAGADRASRLAEAAYLGAIVTRRPARRACLDGRCPHRRPAARGLTGWSRRGRQRSVSIPCVWPRTTSPPSWA